MNANTNPSPPPRPSLGGTRGGGGPPSGRPPAKLPDHLTVEEVEQFLKAVDVGRNSVRDVALVLVLWGTGARVSEVLGATLHDLRVDPETGVGGLKVLGKGSVERELAIPPRAMAALVRYLRPRGWPWSTGPDPVFMSERGRSLSRKTVWKLFRQAAERSGVRDLKPDGRYRIHPHTLRHTCATQLLQAGRDLREVQEYLGHRAISSTQLYTHLDPSRKSAAAQAHPMG